MAVATAAVGIRLSAGNWFGGWSEPSQVAISNVGFKSAREVPNEVLSTHFFSGANEAWSKYLGVLGESPVMAGRAVLPCWSRSVGPCGATRLLLSLGPSGQAGPNWIWVFGDGAYFVSQVPGKRGQGPF